MNLTTISRTLVAALALGGAFLGFAGPAQAASAGAVSAVAPMDGPEPVELDELGLPDVLED
ncbi:hypothetical protein GCM10010222_44130 [Streptomyces tanashiensis]|uniref:hypothetical protein n=1 Tax=Streptomyces tanashiensis TaxID=67367 RepID=UPI0016763384|nr:hypothetical protein [Streptomyces tanashiensis]GGS97611.1 hypothetical protein GCM10010222_44130 [Streptomyces tanashiensis]